MKKICIIISFLFSFTLSKAQVYTYDDIFKINKVYFYGYDFTHFKFVESKRVGQDLKMKDFIFELIEWMNSKKTAKKYENLIDKDTVIFDQKTVTDLNIKIRPENIMGAHSRTLIPQDSLQNIIKLYNTKGKTGIGFVQIIECFYRPDKEATVWFVFFDISSKKILDAYEQTNYDADSYHGLAEFWGVGLSCGMGQYKSKHYKSALKKSKK